MDKELILKYALQNAVKYDGKANAGAVIGKIFSEKPELKTKATEIAKEVNAVIKEVNSMKQEEQLKKLQEIAPELLEKKQKEGKRLFEFLKIKGKVVTAFPPEPSKYPHIGHAKALLLNYELAKEYNGRFIIRFEDTNPRLANDKFYKIHLENYKWLGIQADEVVYVSDYMEKFYGFAESLIKSGDAYVCLCSQEKVKESRMKGAACKCRKRKKEENLKLWKEMFDIGEGKAILRLKIDLKHKNSTMRDPTIMRIIDEAHPRTGKKYRVWPNYDFENAVMDGLLKITHRLRSKEFEMRNELQRYIQKLLGFNETRIYEFARFNLSGVESSGRIIREKIAKNELTGWDDPSLTTLVALRRRGFTAEAIKTFLLKTGITKAESVLTWDDLMMCNKRVVDAKCNRYFFIDKPKKITVENAPQHDVKLKLHPEFPERGYREYNVMDEFYITEHDLKGLKDGKLYRLMDCLNFKKQKNSFVFDSLEYEAYKQTGQKIMHWLPVHDKLVDVEIFMPNKETVKGIAEPLTAKLKEGDVIQFERFGFCRLDKKEKDRLLFWFTHK